MLMPSPPWHAWQAILLPAPSVAFPGGSAADSAVTEANASEINRFMARSSRNPAFLWYATAARAANRLAAGAVHGRQTRIDGRLRQERTRRATFATGAADARGRGAGRRTACQVTGCFCVMSCGRLRVWRPAVRQRSG